MLKFVLYTAISIHFEPQIELLLSMIQKNDLNAFTTMLNTTMHCTMECKIDSYKYVHT